jgi:VIT1/CCC1 family predicted Fe2+/Mn2+ transporter
MNKKMDWSQFVKEGAVLAPIDRVSEVLFGLIMVLSFTGAISAGTDSREDVRELLWAALGCNIAWGLVDAIMYWMSLIVERGHAIQVIRRINSSQDKESNRKLIQNELSPAMSKLIREEEVDHVVSQIKKIPEPTNRLLLTFDDFRSGLLIFSLVFLCTLPVALPFAFISEMTIAMRVSNGIALLMLFLGGYILAGFAGFKKFLSAVVYVGIGLLLVALTIALGG